MLFFPPRICVCLFVCLFALLCFALLCFALLCFAFTFLLSCHSFLLCNRKIRVACGEDGSMRIVAVGSARKDCDRNCSDGVHPILFRSVDLETNTGRRSGSQSVVHHFDLVLGTLTLRRSARERKHGDSNASIKKRLDLNVGNKLGAKLSARGTEGSALNGGARSSTSVVLA